MTDPLGQSQVMPYLFGLSSLGYNITILSFEKKNRFEQNSNHIKELLNKHNIAWEYLMYTAKPPVISAIYDFWRMKLKAKKLHRKLNFSVVHCRSYLPAMAGLSLKKSYGVKLLFDMRGFWADERVEGNIWNTKRYIFKKIYIFFKSQEKILLKNADYVVSLTQAGKNIISSRMQLDINNSDIEVIPCCADFSVFNTNNIDINFKNLIIKECDIKENEFILSYLGSIGSWYMLSEMLDFFIELQKIKPSSKFLFITKDNPEHIISVATQKGIPSDRIIVKGGNREQMPTLISLSTASIFFIKPVFSKQASSPTKMAEIMGMGIPIFANSGVGDVDLVFNEYFPQMLVQNFSADNYKKIIKSFFESSPKQELLKEIAKNKFSVEDGIIKYDKIYNSL